MDFSEVEGGKYAVEMFDENGETIMWYELEIEKTAEPEIPDTPTVPDEPTTPVEPTKPDTPDNPNDSDKPTEEVKGNSSNVGLIVGLLMALVLLSAGGVVAFLLIRKKRKNKIKGDK